MLFHLWRISMSTNPRDVKFDSCQGATNVVVDFPLQCKRFAQWRFGDVLSVRPVVFLTLRGD